MYSHEEITSRMARVCLRKAPENQQRPLNLDELVADVRNEFFTRGETLESNARSKLATLKSSEEACLCLSIGENAFYFNAKHHEAINYYTKMVAMAPDDSDDLALAYARRSGPLLCIGKLIECLLDTNRALAMKGKISKDERQELERQKETCLNEMRTSTQSAFTHYTGDETDPIRVVTNSEDEAFLESMCQFGNDFIPNASPKIKVECDEQWGRHIVAADDIKPGEILSRQKFFLTEVKSSALYENCSYCLARCYALIPCSSCLEMYCSRECLLQAREAYHKMECKMFRTSRQSFPEIISSVTFTAVRALFIGTKQGTELRTLMEKLKISDIFAEKIDPRNAQFVDDYLAVLRMCRTFNSSMHEYITPVLKTIVQMRRVGFFDNATNQNDDRHCTPFEVGKLLAVCSSISPCSSTMSKDVLDEVELFTAMLLLNHMYTMKTYPFQVYHINDWMSTNRTSAYKTVGAGVNVVHNFLNHSCSPNADYLVKNREQLLFAMRPIKKGEQITLSYAGHFVEQSLKERRSQQKRYNFVCQCEACTNDWPDLKTLFERNTNKFFNESLALVDLVKQLGPLFKTIEDNGISDLSVYDILRSTCKIVQWIDTHVERPSPVFMRLEHHLDVFMDLMFDESSREYRNADEMRALFDIVLRYLSILIPMLDTKIE